MNKTIVSVGKLQWFKMNKTFQDISVSRLGGNTN